MVKNAVRQVRTRVGSVLVVDEWMTEAKTLELVAGRSIAASSLEDTGVLVIERSNLTGARCPDYWISLPASDLLDRTRRIP